MKAFENSTAGASTNENSHPRFLPFFLFLFLFDPDHLPTTPPTAEANDVISAPLVTPSPKPPPPGTKEIPCYDPSTMQSLGTVPAATPADVARAITECRAASKEWARSSFAQRRALMRVLLKYTVDSQETICR